MEQNNYISKKNLFKLTIISYLLPFITGIAVVLPFIVKQNAATLLNDSISHIGFIFSLFMLGMIITSILNGVIVKYIKPKVELYILAFVYLICIIAMNYVTKAHELIPIIIILGLCFGVTTTIPNYIISHSFNGKNRTSKMNRVDLFFSVGSFFYPFIAGKLLAYNFSWVFLYELVIVIWIIILVLISITKFPNFSIKSKNKDKKEYSKWNISVCFIALAIFSYFVSYTGFTYWVQPYFESLGISVEYATLSVTLFWAFYGIGCLFSSFIIKYCHVEKYIIFSAIVALTCYIIIFNISNTLLMLVFISILGLGCSTIFSSGISYGTLILKNPSPMVISLYMGCSGTGTFVGEFYSSYVYEKFGFFAIVIVSAITITISISLFYIVYKKNKFLNK